MAEKTIGELQQEALEEAQKEIREIEASFNELEFEVFQLRAENEKLKNQIYREYSQKKLTPTIRDKIKSTTI